MTQDTFLDHVEVIDCHCACTQWVMNLFHVFNVRSWSLLILRPWSWLNAKWPSPTWPFKQTNKQRILKPRLRSLQGRPVIGCNPDLLSSPDVRKWERRVGVDNGYAELLSLSLSVSLLHTCNHTSGHKAHSASLPLEHNGLLWPAVCCIMSWPVCKACPLIPLSYACFSSPGLHAGQVYTFEPPSGSTFSNKGEFRLHTEEFNMGSDWD